MRIYGIPVADTNVRLLIAQLLADERAPALNLAERLSAALARHESVAPLVPGERDILLRSIPKQPPNGLVSLRKSLKDDQRARNRRLRETARGGQGGNVPPAVPYGRGRRQKPSGRRQGGRGRSRSRIAA
jgi:hypothetical protein